MTSSSESERPSTRNHDRRLRAVLLVLLGVQVYGILFSIALSSVAFTLAVCVFLVVLYRRRGAALHRSGLEGYFLAYIASLLLMLVWSEYPWASLYHTRRVLLIALVYLLPAAFGERRQVRLFIVGLAVVAGVQSLGDIALSAFDARDRVGFFQHYMTSAGMKMMLLLFVVPFVFSREYSRNVRAIIAVSVTATLVALVMTQTRSSWLGMLAGLAVIGVIRHRSVLAGLAVVVILFFVLAPQRYQERVRHMFTVTSAEPATATIGSNTSRVRMWRTAWTMFLDRPVFGLGEGEMWTMYRWYVPDAPSDEGGHMHNSYIHALASAGAVGFAAFLALCFGVAWKEWTSYRRATDEFPRAVALGALAVFVGFAVNGLAEYNAGDHEILVLLWTSVGLVIAANRFGRPGPASGTEE